MAYCLANKWCRSEVWRLGRRSMLQSATMPAARHINWQPRPSSPSRILGVPPDGCRNVTQRGRDLGAHLQRAGLQEVAAPLGVQIWQVEEPSSVEALFEIGAKLPKHPRLAKVGDLVMITAGTPLGVAGTTNLLKVERIA